MYKQLFVTVIVVLRYLNPTWEKAQFDFLDYNRRSRKRAVLGPARSIAHSIAYKKC